MNTDSFISLTTAAFEKVAIQFDLIQYISNQKVVYSSAVYKLSIYFNNFFEVNVLFNFEKTKMSLYLEDFAKYLRFNKQTIEYIQHNQIADEDYYKHYIGEISKICKRVIETIHLDSNVVSSCYYWKEQQTKMLNNDYNVMRVECVLNQLWSEKKYATYLEHYSDNITLIKQSHIKFLLEKRASFARKKTGDSSGTQRDGSYVFDD